MLGMSVYLGTVSFTEHEKRLREMNSAGFQSIFTSLHIPENDASAYKDEVQQLGKLAQELGMELMVDVSPSALDNLGFTWDQAEGLLEWGISGLRLDYGISPKVIAELSQVMRIALNASTVTHEELSEMKAEGLRLEATEAWHNFYPRPETALDLADFIQRNSWLHDEGVRVMAFAPGDGQLRGPLFETLPTLEKHRHVSPLAASLELMKEAYVDKVLIGDPGLSETSLAQFKAYQKNIIQLRAKSFEQADPKALKMAGTLHTNRPDSARDVIRSSESRPAAMKSGSSVPAHYCAPRPKGTITVDNERYLRYQGELQVTKIDLSADERVNVLGQVIEEDKALLKYIGGNQQFELVWC
ncbi:MupG family TIM beta-alpha barrel fold protein [Sporosarcina jeotgali]|uniref:MupG family TIM beta-alpha barrel fold protein n=1 Tax=Sporosarcina jeotgali TaxID=3020056 RepID=A0ABZ0KXC4_9BACL|nr:MupG family TIM beta-alpha barrel fold protein [Sporosarcina sp. B2O-1]WOV84870.1 MupG family TIM beta-alpha barrel fold protein [Sporosarcina sp. B2O-1]